MSLAWTASFKVACSPFLSDGDKIILPASTLEDLLTLTQDLPSPLTFELRHGDAVIHGGVKEFSGETDIAVLPLWMLDALALQEGDSVTIKHKDLPKGTMAKLQPLSSNYRDIDDYRAAFEAHLRAHYNTLTKGQTLSCRYGAQRYSFLVIDLAPSTAVCITDTDLEVDIEPMDRTVETLAPRKATTLLRLEQTIENVTIPGDQYWYCTLDCGDTTNDISVTLKTENGDADLIASPEGAPTVENHVWRDLTSDTTRTLYLTGRTTSTIHVGIHAYGNHNAVVSLKAKRVGTNDTNRKEIPTEQESHTATVQCPNCLGQVREASYMLHESFCARNNVLCPLGCGRVFKKNSTEAEEHWHCDQCDRVGTLHDMDKHVDYFHTSRSCSCQQFTTNALVELAQHRSSTCPDRLITCRYCHTLVPQGAPSSDARDRLMNLSAHESYCGSRTITCQLCKKQIPIKGVSVHTKIHEVRRQSQKLPPLCQNENCVRPQQSNRLGLCQFCFGPFWSRADDPKNEKLVQRVAREIHNQLTTGCGKAWCRNKFCATGNGMAQDANTAAVTLIPIIRPLQSKLSRGTNAPLPLCVDETTTRKRFLAETLEQGTDGRFRLDWCIQALESEREDLDRAGQWLQMNAPRTKILHQQQ